MSTPLVLDSLQRRMKALNSLYFQATESMSAEHVNHFERSGVLPIAFSLFHIINMMDSSFMMLSGQMPIWNDEWQAKVQMAINDHGKELTVAEMENQRIGNYPAFCDYMRTVLERTENYLSTLDPADLERVLLTHPLPERIATTYSARVAGPNGLTVLDGFECWIYQHGLRHMGEIELSRGLVGLGGMTS